MSELAFVLFPGVRARAYLQMSLSAGLRPSAAVLMGGPEHDRGREDWGRSPTPDFDPQESLRTTLDRAGIEAIAVSSLDLDGQELCDTLRALAPRTTVFTGGGILRGRALEAGGRWIHVHPGWLPDHRGSTCTHYGMLLSGQVGVSAFFMHRTLDTGPVIRRERFSVSESWSARALDHSADAWMRAKVLVGALKDLQSDPDTVLVDQDPNEGQTFYVIHPVLKHIALLGAGIGADTESARTLLV